MNEKKDISAVFDEIITSGEKMLSSGKDILSCAEVVIKAIKDLKAIVTVPEAPAIQEKPAPAALPEKKEAPAEKKYTFTEVRGIMAGLAGQGKKAEARALLQKYGVSRLSDLDEKNYAALVAEVKEISNG